MIPKLKIFTTHLKHYHKNGNFYLVIIELFKNNKMLLFDAEKVRETIKALLDFANDLNFDNPVKLYILESLNHFIYLENSIIKQNQSIILENFTNSNYRNIMFLISFENIQEIKNFTKLNEDFYDNEIVTEEQILNIPFKIEYFCVQLILFAASTEGKNSLTETKCQTLLPLEFKF